MQTNNGIEVCPQCGNSAVVMYVDPWGKRVFHWHYSSFPKLCREKPLKREEPARMTMLRIEGVIID